MTDQHDLRDALESLVPDPPPTQEWGAESRGRARRTRVRRIGAVVAAVVVAAVAVPVVRSLVTTESPAVVSGKVHGTGAPACRQLDHRNRLGQSVDSRVVDGATAAEWLRATGDSTTAQQVADERNVTVCVMFGHRDYAVVVARPGRPAVVLHQGAYPPVAHAMGQLDALAKGGATTSDAPFRCPPPGAAPDRTVRNYLPSGATGLLLCYDTGVLYSPREILDSTGLDRVLLEINRAPITYVAPNVTCGGYADFRPYSLVIRYRSGTRTVSMEECRGLALGVYTRDASADLDRTVEHLLLSRGTRYADPPSCPVPDGKAPRGTGDLRHLAAARYCPPGDPGRPLTGAELSRLERWGSSLEPATTQPEGSCAPPAGGWPHLALTDVWGNSFTMTIECRGRRYPATRMPDGSAGITYPISDQQIVQRLLRQLAAG